MLKTHKKLWWLVFIFVFPVIASWFLFYYHTSFRLKTLNYGTLMQPPIEINYLSHEQQKKWRVLYVPNKMCDNACQLMDHQLRQVQKALGKDSDRVKVILLQDPSTSQQLQDAMLKRQLTSLNKIYLVDPLNNLFMVYPGDVNPMNVLKDLKRVLEVSQIG